LLNKGGEIVKKENKKPLTTITLETPSLKLEVDVRKYPVCKYYFKEHGEFAYVFDAQGIILFLHTEGDKKKTGCVIPESNWWISLHLI